jgi:hypothetical protein
MLPSDVAAKLNECANTDFVRMRDWWFGIVSCATALVAFGLVLEAPELIHDLIPIGRKIISRLKKLPVEVAEHETPDWVKVVAFVGWIFIVVGVVGEEFAGIKVKNLDGNVQECSDAKVREATIEAGDAKGSASDAESSAKHAKAEADELVREVTALSPRNLTLDQQRKIAATLKTFWGHPSVTVESYGMDGEGTALATQLIFVLRAAIGVPIVDRRANSIVTGGFEWGISIRGPESELPFMMALQKSLTEIGKLSGVAVNGLMPATGAGMGGNAGMGGSAGMGGGGGPPRKPIIPSSGPVEIIVGIRPPTMLPVAGR